MIKDRVGKQMAPLHAFLRLTCPKMGIIDVSDYLEQLNWTVTYENGDLTITQVGQPNLATFDRAIICCSMNHIDLLQYVLDNGYLNEVDGFTHDIRYNNTHMLVSAATMSQDEAQEAFSNAIRNGPKAIAAQIFGLDVNHKFLEISSSPSAEALNYPIQLPVVGNTMQSAAQLPIPQQPMQMMGPYPWTGSMSELYKPSEIELDFEAIMAMDEWMVTDISNPVDMDNFLETAGGYNPNELFPGRESMQVLQMKCADHSQCLPSPP